MKRLLLTMSFIMPIALCLKAVHAEAQICAGNPTSNYNIEVMRTDGFVADALGEIDIPFRIANWTDCTGMLPQFRMTVEASDGNTYQLPASNR
jgi:hypothetical protein